MRPVPISFARKPGVKLGAKRDIESEEKESYLNRLTIKVDKGCKKYPKEAELRQLHADLKREYLEIAIPKPKPRVD